MQGFAVTAVLLHNSGHVDLSEGDNALQRAADVLIATAHPALGDDRWLPYLFNQYLTPATYDTSAGIQDGKGMGWTDFTGVRLDSLNQPPGWLALATQNIDLRSGLQPGSLRVC